MKMAANSEVRIPIISVVAKPRIRPVPKMNRIIPVRKVVTLESIMDDNAFLNPSVTANLKFLPNASSSLIRSKISTLASTAIPMDNTIPAMPGMVSTAPSEAMTPSKKNRLTNRAMSAMKPARL